MWITYIQNEFVVYNHVTGGNNMNFRGAVTSDIPQLVRMRLAYLNEDHGGMSQEHRVLVH